MLHTITTRPAVILSLICLCLVNSAYAFSVNKSITIGDGIETDGQSTVNGSISVGRAAIISGSLDTVNGQITLDDEASARDVETVNGSIRLGAGVTVDDIETVNGSIRVSENGRISGSITTVNGKINSRNGTHVEGNVSNVNGEIEIDGTAIDGSLSTVNGDVSLTGNTVLQGDLTIEKPGGWSWRKSRKPRVVIGPGVTISGRIYLEREVELFISQSAAVGGVSGEMSMDDAVRFSGSRP